MVDGEWEKGAGRIDSFEQLAVWQEAHKLVLDVYALTRQLPSDERFGLSSQMRRAAVSVPANIAEGFRRRGINDKCHFYTIAHSSLDELTYYFILCRDLGHPIDFLKLRDTANRIGRMLTMLVRSVRAQGAT